MGICIEDDFRSGCWFGAIKTIWPIGQKKPFWYTAFIIFQIVFSGVFMKKSLLVFSLLCMPILQAKDSCDIINGNSYCEGNNYGIINGNGRYFHDCAKDVVVGSGNVIEKEVALPNSIDDIGVSSIGTLLIRSGDKTSLIVQAEDNIQKCLKQVVSGSSNLSLGVYDCSIQTKESIRYILTLSAAAHRIRAEGATRVEIDSISNPRVNLKASGSSSIHVRNINSEKLSVSANGASVITIDKGEAVTQFVDCSGVSQYQASIVKSTNTEVELSGTSSASVRSTKGVSGDVSGISKLTLHGNPESVRVYTSGLASYQIKR